MTQPEVAILIVTYNSGAEIAHCLESTRNTDAAVLVIDNASADETVNTVRAAGFPIITNATNRGFAAAVNQGVRATDAPFLLLLNPDAVLQTGIEALVEQCRTAGAAAAGGLLVSTDGSPQKGFGIRRFPTPAALFFEAVLINRIWPGNPVNWGYRCLDQDLCKPAQIEQPAGAFVLFRRDAWQRVAGFDEGFFPIWFEDVDFCKRLSDAGFQIYYRPEAIARHGGAHSIVTLELGKRTEYWYGSLLRYSIRHFRPAGRILVGAGVAVGAILRFVFGGRAYRNRQLVRSSYAVVKLALRSMRTGNKIQFGEVMS